MRTEELLQQSQSADAGAAEPVARSCSRSRTSSSAPTPSSRSRPRSSRRRPSCSTSRTTRSSRRTARSSWRAPRSRRRPSSSRSSRSTRPSSSPTCATSCARRSTACSSSPSCCGQQGGEPHRRSRSSSRRRSTRRAATCSTSSTRSSTCPRSRPARCRSSRATSRSREVQDYLERSFRPRRRAEGARRSTIELAAGRCPTTIRTDPQRLQQVLKNLLVERVQVHREGQRHAARSRRADRPMSFDDRGAATRRRRVIAFAVSDTGIGIAAGQAAADLRGVPAGRRHDQPQVRRHRPRPLDQPRDRAAARRRDPGRERAGQGQHVHAVPAGAVTSPRGAGGVARAPAMTQRGVDQAPGASSRRGPWSAAERRTPTHRARDRRRPRAPARRRPGAAHHRGRRQVRAHPARHGARAAASRRSWRPAATPGSRSRTSCSRRHHARHPAARLDGWTVLDRLKRNPRTRHIPVHVISVDRAPAPRRDRGRVRLPREAGQQGGARRRVQPHRELPRAHGQAAPASSRTTRRSARTSMRLPRRGRRHRDHGGRDRRGGAARARRRRPSTAWCSTCRCRTSTASSCSRPIKTQPRLENLPIIVYTGKDLSADEEKRLKKYAETSSSRAACAPRSAC